jgi:hypothetical protein
MIAAPEDLNAVVAMDDLAKSRTTFFDRSVMRSDLQKLTDHYSNFGYAFAEADVNIARNEQDKHPGNVTYIMSKGAKDDHRPRAHRGQHQNQGQRHPPRDAACRRRPLRRLEAAPVQLPAQ